MVDREEESARPSFWARVSVESEHAKRAMANIADAFISGLSVVYLNLVIISLVGPMGWVDASVRDPTLGVIFGVLPAGYSAYRARQRAKE